MACVGQRYTPLDLNEKEMPMSAVMPAPATWTWLPEVLEFAAEQHASAYLQPLREALGRLFPSAQKIAVSVQADPDIAGERCIVFDLCVPQADVSDYVAAKRRWHRELFAVCPAPLACLFCLGLIAVEA
jgi:hypothetical protein